MKPDPLEEAKAKVECELNLEYTSYQGGVERWYFWLLDFLKDNLNYSSVTKVEDKFIASEASSFWATTEQKKAAQQEKAMTYVAHIGNMTKSIFQIVRELRIMDERLKYYQDSNSGKDSAEIALKSLWVDMVEGGGKNPGSVTSLGMQVGFITLPDFFYSVHPREEEDIEKFVKNVDTNEKVREVLKRKLFQYLAWRNNTEKELNTRRLFVLKSLRQHFNTIKLYMQWVKPYLQNVAKLQLGDTGMEPELITATEGALIDLDILGVKWQEETIRHPWNPKELKTKVRKRYHPAIRLTFHFRTVPEMMFQQEYQRAPIHVGKTTIQFRGYVLTAEQIQEYKDYKDKETLDLIESMNASLAAMKDDIEEYLKQAGEEDARLYGEKEEKKEEAPEKKTIVQSALNFLLSLFGIETKGKEAKKPGWKEQTEKEYKEQLEKPASYKERIEKAKLAKDEIGKPGSGKLWLLYETFKKANGMTTW